MTTYVGENDATQQFRQHFFNFYWVFMCNYYINLQFCWRIVDPGFILPTKKVQTAFGKEKMLAIFHRHRYFDNIAKKGYPKRDAGITFNPR